MTLNPFIPGLPVFVSFFLYGWMVGALWQWWRRGGHGCSIAFLFWYAYAALLAFLFMLLTVQTGTNQLVFLAGVLLPYARRAWQSDAVQEPLAIASDVAGFFRRLSMQGWQAWQSRSAHRDRGSGEGESRQEDKGSRSSQDEAAFRREQARRQQEARERREQAERERHREEREERTSSSEPEARSPEEILGLIPPWTQEDLKTAYKREAGRTHPDKWIGKPEAIRQAMEAEYKAIQEAYRVLRR